MLIIIYRSSDNFTAWLGKLGLRLARLSTRRIDVHFDFRPGEIGLDFDGEDLLALINAVNGDIGVTVTPSGSAALS